MSVPSKILPVALSGLVLGALGLLAGSGGRADRPAVEKVAATVGKPVTKTRPQSAAASAVPRTSRPVVTRTSHTAEQMIRRALQTKIDLKFKQTPLKDVLRLLAEKGDFNLVVEHKILADEGISLDDPVTDDLKQVTIRQVLDWTLHPLGLTWVIEDEVLKVTTLAAADDKLYTRTYNVKTLLDFGRRYRQEHPELTIPQFGAGYGCGGQMGGGQGGGGGFFSISSNLGHSADPRPRAALFQFQGSSGTTRGFGGPGRGLNSNGTARWLIDLIETTTSSKWENIDGEGGTLQIVDNVLIIRQTQKVHEEVAALLTALEGVANRKAQHGVIAVRPAGYPRKEDDAIRAALRQAVSVEYAGKPLASVLTAIAAQHRLRIRIQYKILEDEGIATDDQVSLHVKKVTLRSALHLILKPLGLTIYVADGALWVTTITEADEERTAIVYDVRDLAQDDQNAALIDLIENETSGNWEDVDGEGGTIAGAAAVGGLVIRQTAKVQNEITALLADLRKTMPELPKPQKPKVDPNELITRVYNLNEKTVAEEWSKAIPRLIAPKTWGDGKNAGLIQQVGKTLIIRQTRAIQRQIGSLLVDVSCSPVYAHPPSNEHATGGATGGGAAGCDKSGAGGKKTRGALPQR